MLAYSHAGSKSLYLNLSLGDRTKVGKALFGELDSAWVSLTGIRTVDRNSTIDCRHCFVWGVRVLTIRSRAANLFESLLDLSNHRIQFAEINLFWSSHADLLKRGLGLVQELRR